jgi:hypothetical protein
MKRSAAFLLVLTALTLAPFDAVVADGARFAYAGPALAHESACSLGWWQTLRYGHVRPVWGVRCMRYGQGRRVD